MLPVPITASLPLDGHDLAVEALGHAVGDPVAAEGQDVLKMSLNQSAHFAHWGKI